ncbi:MAG TPA: carbohydrate-binding protein, partial [Anaerolineales bacterium]|nr:carbohydrate-binding protein [Anaerolineales bacterium]
YAKSTNRGTFEIRVDGSLVTTINPYASTKTWQNTYTSPLYTDSLTHTVEIKNISTGGLQVDIDAIQVAPLPGPAGPGIYDDTDPRWSYSANWTPITGSTGPYNNTFHYTETTNATASFTFQAPATFTFYYAKYSQRGKFEIWVDGGLLVTIDPYATTKTWQNTYISPAYTDTGTHTIEIKNISTGGLQVDVDAIQISP